MSPEREGRLVLVVGVGRSGTSLLAGILGQLGLRIPQPEVKADETNPRGFGEPRWVVDFHTRLLRRNRVTVNDARPAAWELMGRTAEDPEIARELRDWLAGELTQHGAVVVKDPRTSWFLPLWKRCAQELGVPPAFVTMLRHPAETLTSARKSYGTWQTPASRAGAWMNVSLETERATRGGRRAFIRYDDLLGDWRSEVARVAMELDLPELRSIEPERAARVDEFVDPTLRRNRVGWDELDDPVPPGVRALGEDVWSALQPLTLPDGNGAGARLALDGARAAYATMYTEAEALAQSSITAAKRRRPKPPPVQGPPPTLYVRVARRVPARYRKRVRKALRALRRPT
jgi:hypothetical protein